MNILDLNDDIMSKIKHNLFLKSLMKHRKDNFEFVNRISWVGWEHRLRRIRKSLFFKEDWWCHNVH
eukprot:SAG11_NODE_10915_length_796_cov_32.292683_2_plen_66_part_00